MYSWMAFGLAPESIRSEANVCRHSWRVIGSSFAVPAPLGPLADRHRCERQGARAPEHEPLAAAVGLEEVLVQIVA
jgi:hypothetical protein